MIRSRRTRALEAAVRQLYACIVHGPDGCGSLDPHPMEVGAYLVGDEVVAVAREIVDDPNPPRLRVLL